MPSNKVVGVVPVVGISMAREAATRSRVKQLLAMYVMVGSGDHKNCKRSERLGNLCRV